MGSDYLVALDMYAEIEEGSSFVYALRAKHWIGSLYRHVKVGPS